MSEGVVLGFYFLGIFTGVVITGVVLLILASSKRYIDIFKKDEKEDNW